MPSLTEEQRICLAIWRKASLDPENFILRLPTKSTAETVKRTLYRVIKPYREGLEYDPILTDAAQKLIPKIGEDLTGHTITFSGRETLAALQDQLEAMGILPEDVMSEAELAAHESLKKLAVPETPANPFYDRSDG